MKKTYISPVQKCVSLSGIVMMAVSLPIVNDTDTEVDTDIEGGQLGRENKGSSNIWDQTW